MVLSSHRARLAQGFDECPCVCGRYSSGRFCRTATIEPSGGYVEPLYIVINTYEEALNILVINLLPYTLL